MNQEMRAKNLPAPQPVGRRLSSILKQLSAGDTDGRISIGDIVNAIGNRAFGALIFAFAAPIVLPIPVPGIAIVLGLPLLLLTGQLMIGLGQPWLPTAVLRRSFARRDFARIVAQISPRLERLERVIGPRHLWITEPVGERLIGSVGFVFSLAVLAPIPFGNMLPGLALALVALGLLERDGRLILAGGLAGVIGLSILLAIGYGLAVGAALFRGGA